MEKGKAIFVGRLLNAGCYACFLFALAAASFHGYYETPKLHDAPWGNPQGKGSFEREMDGTDFRPFVYRNLMPWIVNEVCSHVSESAKDKLFNLKGRTGLLFRDRIIDSWLARDRKYFLNYWLLYGFVFLTAWASAAASFWFAQDVGFSTAESFAATAVLLILIPYFDTGVGHYYDYLELMFLSGSIVVARRLGWGLLLPLAALATWNKETFLFFIPTLYPFLADRYSRSKALIVGSATGVASAVVFIWLHLRFSGNPGGILEIHFTSQMLSVLSAFNPRSWVMSKTYGVWTLQTVNPFAAVLLTWAVVRAWPGLSVTFRRHARIAAAIMIPLYLLFCEAGELRDLSFLYPTLLLVAASFLAAGGRVGQASHSMARQGAMNSAQVGVQ